MTESELRSRLLARLNRIADRLPNGLLHRLVEDAQFFSDWNMRKKRARASARLGQYKAWQGKAEELYWKSINR
jgi:hypothetical protein